MGLLVSFYNTPVYHGRGMRIVFNPLHNIDIFKRLYTISNEFRNLSRITQDANTTMREYGEVIERMKEIANEDSDE